MGEGVQKASKLCERSLLMVPNWIKWRTQVFPEPGGEASATRLPGGSCNIKFGHLHLSFSSNSV